MADKKFYWLKLHDDFFSSKRIKKLRKLGSDFVIIYLKMQLLSLSNGGVLEFTGIEDNFCEEIALDIDEDADKVQLTISYLQSCGLLETTDKNEFFLPYVERCTGSETKWAEYKRSKRIGQCPIDVQTPVGNCLTEKEIDIEIDIEKDNIGAKSKRFVPPSVDEVQAYCTERMNNVDAQAFVDFYESKGWYVGKNKMKDWKSAVRTWERNRKSSSGSRSIFDELRDC